MKKDVDETIDKKIEKMKNLIYETMEIVIKGTCKNEAYFKLEAMLKIVKDLSGNFS